MEKGVSMDWETLIGNKDQLFARFRSCLLRTNLNAEAIAALKGAPVEEGIALEAYTEMISATRVTSDCHFAVQLNHFISFSQLFSLDVFLK